MALERYDLTWVAGQITGATLALVFVNSGVSTLGAGFAILVGVVSYLLMAS